MNSAIESPGLGVLEAPEQWAASLGNFVGRAHLDEYFGPWAVEEGRFRALVERVGKIDLAAHVAQTSAPAAAGSARSEGRGDVAVVHLCGPLMKQVSSLAPGCSTIAARRAIREAARSESIGSIALVIDSPGGTVAGTQALADEVAKAAAQKPVYAYIEDLGASAAYWVASRATKIYANETALVGSIGTFAVLYDSSRRAENMGVEVHVIRAGDHKGAGTPGAPVTDAHLAEARRVVESLNEHFLAAVAAGRGMSDEQVRALADGRVHVGAEAMELGLVDAIAEFDGMLADMAGGLAVAPAAKAQANMKTNNKPRLGRDARAEMDEEEDEARRRAMDDEEDESAEGGEEDEPESEDDEEEEPAASYRQIKAECVGADSGFICRMLDRGASIPVARRAWMAEQNKRLASSQSAPAKKTKRRGLSPVGSGSASGGGPRPGGDDASEFSRLASQRMRERGETWAQASGNVRREFPDLHTAFLLKTNSRKVAARITGE